MLFILVSPAFPFLLPRSFHSLLHVHLLRGDRVWGICGLHHPLQPEADSSYHQSHAKRSFQCRGERSFQCRCRPADRREAGRQQLGGEEGADRHAAGGSECELGFSGECLLETEIRGGVHGDGWSRGATRREGALGERCGGRRRCF